MAVVTTQSHRTDETRSGLGPPSSGTSSLSSPEGGAWQELGHHWGLRLLSGLT